MNKQLNPLNPISYGGFNWWEVGGKTCLAAYQAKGASSQSDAISNLANPGTYDLSLILGTVGWSQSLGFLFTNSGAYTTGLNASSVGTVIVSVLCDISAIHQSVLGANDTTSGKLMRIRYDNNTNLYLYNGGTSNYNTPRPADIDGVWCMAEEKMYLDGSYIGASSGGLKADYPIYLGAYNYNNTSTFQAMNGSIAAVAFYVEELTPTDVTNLTANIQSI